MELAARAPTARAERRELMAMVEEEGGLVEELIGGRVCGGM